VSSPFSHAIQRLLVLSLILLASAESPAFAFAAQQQTQPPASTGQDPRIGQRVMVSKHGAQLKTPQSTVWTAWLGEVYTISLTNGEWLWIAEKGGWLWEKETILFDTAIAELSNRLSKNRTAENLNLRGVAYLAHDQYQPAEADFTASLQLLPKNPGALNNRGKARHLMGAHKLAIADFTEALRLEPGNVLFLNNRALAAMELADYPRALTDLQDALLKNPNFVEALNNRGIVRQKMQRYDEAITDFTAALKVNPQYIDALGNRAYSWRQKSEFTKAIADLEEAIRLSPRSFEATNDLAWILATCPNESFRNPARAIELAKSACAMTEYRQWNTLDTLAAALASAGQYEEAGKWSATAVEQCPPGEKERMRKHLALIVARKPVME
jgi:tetratricopeptide (TPR) repeat protein